MGNSSSNDSNIDKYKINNDSNSISNKSEIIDSDNFTNLFKDSKQVSLKQYNYTDNSHKPPFLMDFIQDLLYLKNLYVKILINHIISLCLK